jgi:hypothetical protein
MISLRLANLAREDWNIMNRLGLRAVIWIVALAIGGGSYLLADITSCDGPKAESWAEGFVIRGEAALDDYDTWNVSTTPASHFSSLAGRAQERYTTQDDANAPGCLNKLQGQASGLFYSEWQMYEAIVSGNWDLAAQHESDFADTFAAMEQEFYRLAAEYDWDLEE